MSESEQSESEQSVPQKQTVAGTNPQVVVRANYELFVLILAILQVMNSILIVALPHDPAMRIPTVINYGLAIFFMLDAFYRLWKTPNRRQFFFRYRGFLVFLGSLPFPFTGLFRLIWYQMAVTQLRRADFSQMQRVVVRKRAQSATLVIFLAAIIMLEVSSILVIEAESRSPEATIITANDAIWWALVTMATVGYGDLYPVTPAGRVVALFVMLVGVGIFTVLTSFFAQSFIKPRRERDEIIELGAEQEPADARASLEAIKQLLDQQESAQNASLVELRDRLDALEDQLMSEPDKK